MVIPTPMSGNGNSENNKNLYSKVQSHFSESSQHYYPLKHHATWPDSIRTSPDLPHSSIMALRFTNWTPERLHEVLKLGQPLCEAFKLHSGPRGTGILTKPILKKFKCPDGGRGGGCWSFDWCTRNIPYS